MLLTAAISSAFTLAGALAAGVVGTVTGMAFGAWMAAMLAWWQFRKAFARVRRCTCGRGTYR